MRIRVAGILEHPKQTGALTLHAPESCRNWLAEFRQWAGIPAEVVFAVRQAWNIEPVLFLREIEIVGLNVCFIHTDLDTDGFRRSCRCAEG